MSRTQKEIIYKDLSYKLGGIFYAVHDVLGRYAREKQYGDLLERMLKEKCVEYEREKLISKTGEDVNRADFVIENKIILELKAKPFINRDGYNQTKRYLEFSDLFLGIIINFQQKYLCPKRVINSKYSKQ